MFDPILTTNRIGMAADGTVYQCTPTGQVPLDAIGPGVAYGAPLVLNRGDAMPMGFWEVIDGSMTAGIGGATIRQILIGG